MNFAAIRDKIRKEPKLGGAIAGGVLLLALIIAFIGGGSSVEPRPRIEQMYYLDLVTREFFPGSPNAHPPIKSPSGNDAARAFVFACDGKCDDEANFIVSYLVKYEPGALELLKKRDAGQKLSSDEEMLIELGHKIGLPDGSEWRISRSPWAAEILNGKMLQGKCPGKIVACHP